MEKLPPLRKMSWKTPQNVEEMKWQWGNILVLGAKHGETAAAEEECPGKRHNSGRKLWGGRETSWFWG